MALLPLLWLMVWRRTELAFWWLAVAFGVSWLADSAAHYAPPWLISAVYPVSQAAIIGMIFLTRWEAQWLALWLVFVGIESIAWHGIEGPEILLHTVAWGSAAVIASRSVSRLRIPILLAFGLGTVAWMGYAAFPGWWSWSIFQGIRAAALVSFCMVTHRPRPVFRLVHA